MLDVREFESSIPIAAKPQDLIGSVAFLYEAKPLINDSSGNRWIGLIDSHSLQLGQCQMNR